MRLEVEQKESANESYLKKQLKHLSDSQKSGGSFPCLYKIPDFGNTTYNLLEKASLLVGKFLSGGYLYDYDPEIKKYLEVISYLKERKHILGFAIRPSFHDVMPVYGISFATSISDDATDGKKRQNLNIGFSAAHDSSLALSKSIGEFLERYTLYVYKRSNLMEASVKNLRRRGKRFLAPDILSGFSDEQKKQNKTFEFDDESLFSLINGRSLDGRTILLPAQCVFWGYEFQRGEYHEPILREPNTSGNGGNFTLIGAILSGVYETIERDAFLRYWLSKKAPPPIKNINDEALLKILELAERFKISVTWFDTTGPTGIFSTCCVLQDDTRIGPKVSVASCCGFNVTEAMEKAYYEALGLFNSLRATKNKKEDGKEMAVETLGRTGRLMYWASAGNFSHFGFFLDGEPVDFQDIVGKNKLFNDLKDELHCIQNILKSTIKDAEIYYFTPQHKILKDLGYYTSCVIIPGLIPLYLREKFIPLGMAKSALGIDVVNPYPHPFP